MGRPALVALGLAVAAVHLLVIDGLPRPPPIQAKPQAVQRLALARVEPATGAATQPPAPATTESPSRRANRSRAAAAPALPASQGEPAAPPASEPSGLPASVPAPIRLQYTVTASLRGAVIEGRSVLDWAHDGERYQAEWIVTGPPALARRQRSTGRITPAGLAPQRYAERLRSEQAVHFDWPGQRLVFSARHEPAPLPPAAQDRLSALLQVGALLTARPRAWVAGDTLVLPVATAQALEVWTFAVEGEQALQLPGGTLRVLHLVRLPNGEFAPRIDLWLDPGQAYAPVRLRLTLPLGDWIEHQWPGTDSP